MKLLSRLSHEFCYLLSSAILFYNSTLRIEDLSIKNLKTLNVKNCLISPQERPVWFVWTVLVTENQTILLNIT